jgi:hypothetical protein
MSVDYMFAYNQASAGGRELADALQIKRVKHTGSTLRPRSTTTILNWGASSSRFPQALKTGRIINPPELVDVACDKLKSFRAFQEAGVPIPEFTEDRAVAIGWLEAGTMVFARTELTAHSGRGIVIMEPSFPESWEVTADLYVKYVPKKDEYRIHVLRGEVIDVQRKGLREELRGTEGVNFKVRNLANGFVYVRNDGRTVPESVLTVGRQAVAALNLDFGAADIIYVERTQRAYALEVNCAPGLTGTTVENYAEAFRNL